VRTGSTEQEKLLIYFWVASLVPLVGLAKVGSNLNYWIEFAAITAVLATLGIWSRLGEVRVPSSRTFIPLLLLGLTVAAVAPRIASAAVVGLGVLEPNPKRLEEFSGLIERVRSEPRDVLANPLDVVVLARRPTLLEPYLFNILGSEGRWDERPLLRRICVGDVGLLVLNHPLEGGGPAYHGYAHWPPSVLAALRETSIFDAHQAGRFVYSVHKRTDGETCALVLHQDGGDG
jgi:hypothetical protein